MLKTEKHRKKYWIKIKTCEPHKADGSNYTEGKSWCVEVDNDPDDNAFLRFSKIIKSTIEIEPIRR